eukprot:4458641-Heterocapsa_arctica.AAC.1
MGAFPSLLDQSDAKLTQAINIMMTGMHSDLTRRLYNMKERCIKDHGNNTKGRQLFWTIYEFFKVDPSSGTLFGIEDLMAVILR